MEAYIAIKGAFLKVLSYLSSVIKVIKPIALFH